MDLVHLSSVIFQQPSMLSTMVPFWTSLGVCYNCFKEVTSPALWDGFFEHLHETAGSLWCHQHHLYENDAQLYIFGHGQLSEAVKVLSHYLEAMGVWMRKNSVWFKIS